jgi:hypothetical protein
MIILQKYVAILNYVVKLGKAQIWAIFIVVNSCALRKYILQVEEKIKKFLKRKIN